VRPLTRLVSARVERLPLVGAAVSMPLQQPATVLRQRDGALVLVQRHALDESLVFEMAEIERFVSRIAEVALRHDPKRPDGRQRSRFRTVQRVLAVAIVHLLALGSTRQIDSVQEDVARIATAIVIALARLTVTFLAPIVVTIANVVIGRIVAHRRRPRTAPDRQPSVFAIANPVVVFA
jgi:hypothetical protein